MSKLKFNLEENRQLHQRHSRTLKDKLTKRSRTTESTSRTQRHHSWTFQHRRSTNQITMKMKISRKIRKTTNRCINHLHARGTCKKILDAAHYNPNETRTAKQAGIFIELHACAACGEHIHRVARVHCMRRLYPSGCTRALHASSIFIRLHACAACSGVYSSDCMHRWTAVSVHACTACPHVFPFNLTFIV